MAEHASVLGVLAVTRSNRIVPDIEVLSAMQEQTDKEGGTTLIKFNISGQAFTVSQRLVNKYPTSKLASAKELESYWSKELQVFYFDRDPALFNAVLNIFRYNALIVPPGYDMRLVMEEVAFWDVQYHKSCNEDTEEERLEKEFQALENRFPPPKETDSGFLKWRYKVWCFITDPFGPHTKYRKLSLAYSIFTISAVFFYLIIHGLSTSVYYRESLGNHSEVRIQKEIPNMTTSSMTTEAVEQSVVQLDDKVLSLGCKGEDKMDCFLRTRPVAWIDQAKIILVFLFSFETLLRLILCPGLGYFKSVINWLDIIATSCVVCTAGVGTYMRSVESGDRTRGLGFTFELLQSLQVLRVFKIFQVCMSLNYLVKITRLSHMLHP